jgi:predicted nucleic acid-binding protein
MISIDTSVAVKWFKPGERYESEALDLLTRIDRGEVVATANEIISLEVVRALKNAQVRQPVLGITDARIHTAYQRIEDLFAGHALLECRVGDVKAVAKDAEMSLGLFMADAVHLATAIYLGVQYFVVDDRHFQAPPVLAHASSAQVRVVDLPTLIAALSAASGGASSPIP